LRAVVHAAVEHDGDEIGEAAEIAEGGADLDGKFARRFEHEHPGPLGAMRTETVEHRQGEGAVLPVPVGAEATRSRPASTTGMPAPGWGSARHSPEPGTRTRLE